MTDSVAPQLSWIPLMESALCHQAGTTGSYVLPNAKCSIIYGPEPAFFDDGQLLAKTHYHVDACLWAQDTFIDGATFLMPSKAPEAGLESYSVDLDDTTGIHHVFLRKASLRTSLALKKSSKPNYASHVVEFSNGKMTAVPRVHCVTTGLERGVQKIQCREHQWSMPIAQSEPVHPQYADSQPSLANSTVSTPHKTISHRTTSPAISDSSITEFGRVVRQQAADDQSSLCAFSKSISHIVPWISTVSTCTTADDPDAAARAQEPVIDPIETQTSETYSISRRSSAGSQDSRTPPSTVPTSPTFSTFSTVSFEKSALVNSPKVPIAPGKLTYMVEALVLERVHHGDLENDNDSDRAVLRRHSLDLSFSHRQLIHLDKIQNSESPCLQEVSGLKIGLAMTEDGQIVIAEDASNNAESSPSLPQLTSEPVEACPSNIANTSNPTQCGEVLDLLQLEFARQLGMPSPHLDCGPSSNGKQSGTQPMIDNQRAFVAFEENGDDKAAIQASGSSDVAAEAGKT